MSETLTITQRLLNVQEKLKAPKGQYNKFSHFNFRSVEDVMEAVKPLNIENGLLLTLTDKPIQLGDRVYIEATANLTDGKETVSVQAYAREPLNKKGFDESQLTGTASSYARKYALSGLYLIDDNKDPDTNENNHMAGNQLPPQQQQQQPQYNNQPQQQQQYNQGGYNQQQPPQNIPDAPAPPQQNQQQPNNAQKQPARANEKQMGLLHQRAEEVAQLYRMTPEELKLKLGVKDVHTETEFTQILQRLNDGAETFNKTNGN